MSSTEAAPVREAAKPAGRPAARTRESGTSHASAAEVRKFGAVLIAGFGLIGAILFWRARVQAAEIVWAGAAAVGLLAIALPGPMRPVHRAWMAAAHVLGRINTAVLVTVLHLVVVTGLGLIFRLFGRDELQLSIDREAKTYWQKKAMRTDARSYFDQF
jgi:hypothetical protein